MNGAESGAEASGAGVSGAGASGPGASGPGAHIAQGARIAVIGAGAAGLMAALWAARRSSTVEHARGRGVAAPATRPEIVLLERTRDGGRKILVSGGGRSNVLPSVAAPERFVTDSSPNVLRRILRSWPLAEQRRFFEHDLGLHLVLEAESGKLFPDTHHAKDVRDALVHRAERDGVRLVFRTKVVGIERAEGGGPGARGGWTVRFEDDPPLHADAVILATGGLSVPKTGSEGFGLDAARRLGHRLVPTYPALTPLLGGDERHHALAGVSLRVRLTAGSGKRRVETRGGFLFTHRGFSGPSVLDLSHHVVREIEGAGEGDASGLLRVAWDGEHEPWDDAHWDAALRPDADGPRSVGAVLRTRLPERLAAMLAAEAGVDPGCARAELPRAARLRLVENLVRWPVPATGHEGYRKAEVTGGGVHLGEVDPRTLASRRAAGLFLAGELLDAFGPIGGHNFQWAWATGRAAGEAAVEFVARD